MDNKKEKQIQKLTLALGIALLPPIWAVLIGESVPKYIFVPSWLCGWAIGLTIMGPMSIHAIGTLPVQIGVAMIAGVVYVGIGVDAFQKFLIKKLQ